VQCHKAESSFIALMFHQDLQVPWTDKPPRGTGKHSPFLGELTQGVATAVELPDTAFWSVINIQTRTLEYLQAHPDE
jgi:hypothetical protein